MCLPKGYSQNDSFVYLHSGVIYMRKGSRSVVCEERKKTVFVDESLKLAELHFNCWQVPFFMDQCQ